MTTVLKHINVMMKTSDRFYNNEFLSKYENFTTTLLVKSFGLGDASLVQIMACRLFDAKSLFDPKLTYCRRWGTSAFENVARKMSIICLSLNVLTHRGLLTHDACVSNGAIIFQLLTSRLFRASSILGTNVELLGSMASLGKNPIHSKKISF